MPKFITAVRTVDLTHPNLAENVGVLYTGRRFPVTLSEALIANPFEPLMDEFGRGLL